MSIASKIIELGHELEISGFCVSDMDIHLTKPVIASLVDMQIFRVNSRTDVKTGEMTNWCCSRQNLVGIVKPSKNTFPIWSAKCCQHRKTWLHANNSALWLFLS